METVLADLLYSSCGKVPENNQVRCVIMPTAACGSLTSCPLSRWENSKGPKLRWVVLSGSIDRKEVH